jgi:uncharacterized protein
MIDVLWFVLVLAIIGAMLAIAVAAIMAIALLRPPRMSDGKASWVLKRVTPLDLGLAYETTQFDIRDELSGRPLRLAAWWMPSADANGRCIVLIHGYSDAKVGAIAWAPMLHELGWNILAVDLRAHGESDGRFITGGCIEQLDIEQVVDELRARRPEDTRQLVLFGLSLGATIAAAVADRKDDLSGVILDSPPADERHAVMVQFDLMGTPGRWLQRLAIRMARWMAGAQIAAVRPVELIERIQCPLLLILCEDDPYLNDADRMDIESAIGRRAEAGRSTAFWRVPEAGHLLAICAQPQLYRQRIGEFLEYIAGHE